MPNIQYTTLFNKTSPYRRQECNGVLPLHPENLQGLYNARV